MVQKEVPCSLNSQKKQFLADLLALKSELIERTYDYVIASSSLRGKINNMEVVEDFESRPHQAVTFLVEREKEIQEVRELKMSEALLGFSGDKMPSRSNAEGGKEENDDEDEVCWVGK